MAPPLCWPATSPSRLEIEAKIVFDAAVMMGKTESWLTGKPTNQNPENTFRYNICEISTWNGIGVENGRITRIDWYDEGLVGEIPESLGRLTALTYLFLGDNNLYGPLPPALGSLSRLRQLNLSRNMLTGQIPRSWSGMTSLEEMGVYNNQLDRGEPEYLGGEELKRWIQGARGMGGGGDAELPKPPVKRRFTEEEGGIKIN